MTRGTVALPLLTAVVLAGCTHTAPQAAQTTHSPAATALSGFLPITCRQAYAASATGPGDRSG